MALAFPAIRPDLLTVPAFHVGGATLGPFAVRWYALAYIVGILLGWRYAISLVKTPRLWGGRAPTATPLQIDDLILWVTIGVIVGGRLGYILFYMLPVADSRTALLADPAEALRVWHGGMSFHGGALGVIVALVLFAARQKIPVLRLADLAAACTPIASSLAGSPTSSTASCGGAPPICPGDRLLRPDHSERAGWCVRRWPRAASSKSALRGGSGGGRALPHSPLGDAPAGWLQRNGAVTGLFLLGYGLFRISLEHVRMPDEGLRNLPFGLTMGMILSTPMVLVGLVLIWRGLARAPAAASLADAP